MYLDLAQSLLNHFKTFKWLHSQDLGDRKSVVAQKRGFEKGGTGHQFQQGGGL